MATRTSRILGPDGEPIQLEVLDREIAAGGLTGVRQVWHNSVASNLGPARLASVLQAAIDGNANEYLTLAEEMEERDLHYASVLGTRKLALSGLSVRVDAYSDDPADQKVADEVRALIALPSFQTARFDLADALGKGYSVCELVWDRRTTPWTPTLVHRDPRFFQFDRATGQELRLLDDADPVNGIPLPPYKFVVHRPKLRSGLPIRGGLARLAAVGYMCKAWSWRDWMAFADIFGLPMRVGTYRTGTSEADIRKLMAAVAGLGSDAAAVIHESTAIKFEAAPNTAGAADFFERLTTFWDKQISKGVLGQTMTADDGASMSQAKVHDGVRLDLLTADAQAESSTWNDDLVRPYVDLNHGHGRYPRVVVVVPNLEDLRLLLEALKELVPMGFEVEQSVIRDRFNLPDPAPGPSVKLLRPAAAAPAAAPGPDLPPRRAENREAPSPAPPDREDQLAALLEREADPAVRELVDAIKVEIDQAASFDDVLAALDRLQAELPVDRVAAVMAEAMAVAGLAGRSDARDDADG